MRPIAVLCFGAALSGCAYVTATEVTSDRAASGIPFYGEKPILVVSGDSAEIKFIPNPSEKYALQYGAFLAQNTVNLVRNENGTLQKIDAVLDSTAVLDTLESLGETILTASGEDQANFVGDPAGSVTVFDFIFDDAGQIIELRRFDAGSTGRSIMAHTPGSGLPPDNR